MQIKTKKTYSIFVYYLNFLIKKMNDMQIKAKEFYHVIPNRLLTQS